MLDDSKWRLMLIELAEKHKSCGLLHYIVQRISEAGHHKEIASVTSASTYFSVFHGVFTDAIERVGLLRVVISRIDLYTRSKRGHLMKLQMMSLPCAKFVDRTLIPTCIRSISYASLKQRLGKITKSQLVKCGVYDKNCMQRRMKLGGRSWKHLYCIR